MQHFDKILVVDDDLTSTYLTLTILEELQVGDTIVTAANGKEALAYIEAHCLATNQDKASFCPDLIFLDINMPVMNGFEFLEACHQKQCFIANQVKIVILTSSSSSKDLLLAKSYQVTDYIVKPFTEQKLSQLFS